MEFAIQKMNLPTSLAICVPSKLFDTYSGVTTVQQAMAAKAPSLLTLTRTDGSNRKKVFGLLQAHLMLISNNSKVKQPLSKMEIDILAEDILRDFFYFSFADINVIFRRFYQGYYGKTYGSLSSADIYQWFRQYDEERCAEAETKSRLEDEKRYATDYAVPNNFDLTQLGYEKDADTGVWHISKAKIEEINENREKEKKHTKKTAHEHNVDPETLAKIRQQVKIQCIMAKPAEERTANEIKLLNEKNH